MPEQENGVIPPREGNVNTTFSYFEFLGPIEPNRELANAETVRFLEQFPRYNEIGIGQAKVSPDPTVSYGHGYCRALIFNVPATADETENIMGSSHMLVNQEADPFASFMLSEIGSVNSDVSALIISTDKHEDVTRTLSDAGITKVAVLLVDGEILKDIVVIPALQQVHIFASNGAHQVHEFQTGLPLPESVKVDSTMSEGTTQPFQKGTYNPSTAFVNPLREAIRGKSGDCLVDWSVRMQHIVVSDLYNRLLALPPEAVGMAVDAILEAFAPPQPTEQQPFPKDTRPPEEREVYGFLRRLVGPRSPYDEYGEERLRALYETSKAADESL